MKRLKRVLAALWLCLSLVYFLLAVIYRLTLNTLKGVPDAEGDLLQMRFTDAPQPKAS